MTQTDDFRDLLALLERHSVRYLIVGGYATAFHARPRYTKDLDILVDDTPGNIRAVNDALAEFGSPCLLELDEHDVILQIGVEPNRIDLLRRVANVEFAEAWEGRVRGAYGDIPVNWIGIEALIKSKSGTGKLRHEEDVKVLRSALERARQRDKHQRTPQEDD